VDSEENRSLVLKFLGLRITEAKTVLEKLRVQKEHLELKLECLEEGYKA